MQKSGDVAIRQVRLLTASCRTQEKIEFAVRTSPCAGNPFRARELALDATVTLPTGRVMQVPCFFFQECRKVGGMLSPVPDSAEWRLRFG